MITPRPAFSAVAASQPAPRAVVAAPVPVGLGEIRVSHRPADVLIADGLGACIALCARDPVARICGMAHLVLPQAPAGPGEEETRAACFADQGVPWLLEALTRDGALVERLRFALVGGAELSGGGDDAACYLGKRNTLAVIRALQERQMRLAAHDVGGAFGRVCQLFVSDGRVLVRAIGAGGEAEERALVVLGTPIAGVQRS